MYHSKRKEEGGEKMVLGNVEFVVYWPSTRPNMPFQRRRKCIFHWRGQAWLTKWDKVKSHGTVIDWCTGRDWPVNCTTVISARWRSNMPFQRLSGRLNYYITRWRQEVIQFGDPLVTSCGRENSTQWSGPSGPQLSSSRERERQNDDDHKSGGQYVAVLFGLQLPLT